MRQRSPKNGGYIALMTTVVIALVLLVFVSEQAFVGSMVRSAVLSSEAKEEGRAAAEGCSELARFMLLKDPLYGGNANYKIGEKTCRVLPLLFDTPEGVTTVRVQSVVRGSYTNLEARYTDELERISYKEVAAF